MVTVSVHILVKMHQLINNRTQHRTLNTYSVYKRSIGYWAMGNVVIVFGVVPIVVLLTLRALLHVT